MTRTRTSGRQRKYAKADKWGPKPTRESVLRTNLGARRTWLYLCETYGDAVGERYLKVMLKPYKPGHGASVNYPSELKQGVEV